MTSIKDMKRAMLDYVAVLEEAEKRVPDLEKKARAFVEQQARRTAIQDRLEELEGKIEPLEAELRGLKQPYLDSLFNMDVTQQRTLQARKRTIEKEIKEAEKTIDAEYNKLDADPVDAESLAVLRAELDSFSVPDVFAFVQSLDLPLSEAANRIEAEVSSIAVDLPHGHDEQVYRSTRMGLDDTYRSQQKRAEGQLNHVDHKQARRGQRIGEVNEREAAIGAGLVDDRVSATVTDRPPLLDEDE